MSFILSSKLETKLKLMLSKKIEENIKSYQDFPTEGVLFRDILSVLDKPDIFKEIIECMSQFSLVNNSDAIIAVDARGFIFGSAVAINIQKPIIFARKPGKLPGDLISHSYELEYGKNTLCLQKDVLQKHNNFCIVDDLLATGGTVSSIEKMVRKFGKNITGTAVVVELTFLNGQSNLENPVESILKYN